MRLLYHLGYSGYYKQGKDDRMKTDQIPARWVFPMVFLMHFGAAVMAQRRMLEPKLPPKYPYSLDDIERSLKLSFSAFAPLSLHDRFSYFIEDYGDGEILIEHENGLDLYFPEDDVGSWLEGEPEGSEWVSEHPKNLRELQPMPGTPALYSKVPMPQLTPMTLSKGKQGRARRGAGHDTEQSGRPTKRQRKP